MIDPSQYEKIYDEADAAQEDICTPIFNALQAITDRYSDPELVGKGGCKEVFRVYDERTERMVAMAYPLQGLAHYDSFLREAHITARLDHSEIIKVLDMGINDDGRPFYTMEFKRGDSLRDRIEQAKETPWPMADRLGIFLRICDAIAYAHSQRVLHLDLKPANIQVGSFGEIKVCDWGLGEVMMAGEPDSTALLDPDLYGSDGVTVKGTPGYMAPEQKDAMIPNSAQTDIFALGCLLQAMVTLEHPGKSLSHSPTLRAIIDRARADKPGDRYESARALRNDIASFLTHHPTSVEPGGFRRETTLFFRRNVIPCSIAVSALLLLCVLAAIFVQQLQASHEQTKAALARSKESQAAAEKALALYESEKDRSESFVRSRDDHAPPLVTRMLGPIMVNSRMKSVAVRNALFLVDNILRSAPESSHRTNYFRGYVLFAVQRFEEAAKVFQASPRKTVMRELSEEYAARMQKGHLTVDEFLQLLERIYKADAPEHFRLLMLENLLYTDAFDERTYEDRVRITKAILRYNNPQWDPCQLQYGNRTLRLSGSNLTNLRCAIRSMRPHLCLLRPLAPLTLDLRGSGISDLGHLKDLDLLELDVRQTPIKDLTFLEEMTSLRILHVSTGQFTRKHLDKLPSTIQIIVEK